MPDAAPDAASTGTDSAPTPDTPEAGVVEERSAEQRHVEQRHPGDDAASVRVRLAVASDAPTVRGLYEDGRAEVGAGGDDDADIECLAATYLADEGASGFWVAEVERTGELVGMVGARAFENHRAEIRRLRVAPEWRRRGIGSRLPGAAVDHCRTQGHLKVVLDVPASSSPAIDLFEKAGFALHREREIGDRTLVEFYLDLYRDPDGRGGIG